MQCSCLQLKYNTNYLFFHAWNVHHISLNALDYIHWIIYKIYILSLIPIGFLNAPFHYTVLILLFFSFFRVLHLSDRSSTVSTREKPFPWKVPAVSLLNIKSCDCCEAVLFSSCLRATAGGETINMAGKVELG